MNVPTAFASPFQIGERRLRLGAEMIEVGSSRKLLGHGSSMQSLGPQSGCTKDVCQRPEQGRR